MHTIKITIAFGDSLELPAREKLLLYILHGDQVGTLTKGRLSRLDPGYVLRVLCATWSISLMMFGDRILYYYYRPIQNGTWAGTRRGNDELQCEGRYKVIVEFYDQRNGP